MNMNASDLIKRIAAWSLAPISLLMGGMLDTENYRNIPLGAAVSMLLVEGIGLALLALGLYAALR